LSGDGCSSICKLEDGFKCYTNRYGFTNCKCGNGKLEPELGEECDDGDQDSEDGCTWNCYLESTFNCVNIVGQKSSCTTICGDNILT